MFVAIILSIRALTFFSTLTVGIVLRSIQRHYDVSAALKKKKTFCFDSGDPDESPSSNCRQNTNLMVDFVYVIQKCCLGCVCTY